MTRTRTAITVYEATDGSLHRDKKAWRARQCWLDLVQMIDDDRSERDVVFDDEADAIARHLVANRADIMRLLRHAEEPTP
jgi:hypothetical protein